MSLQISFGKNLRPISASRSDRALLSLVSASSDAEQGIGVLSSREAGSMTIATLLLLTKPVRAAVLKSVEEGRSFTWG